MRFSPSVADFAGLVAIVFALYTASSAHANPRKPKRVPSAVAQSDALKTLRSAGLDPAKSAVWIGSMEGKARVAHRVNEPLNPASVMKLVTTGAALQTLGAGYTWNTQVDVVGNIHPATRSLKGSLILRGSGDPKLVVERLEPLMQHIRAAGIDVIDGDIVLDRRAFSVPERDPSEFDGEPLRPYNARPDPLLINFKAIVLQFKPDLASNMANITFEPPLAGVAVPASVPLSKANCGDWRGALQADFSNPNAVAFAGSYPAACGERVWPVAYADAASHSARAVAAMWAKVGGLITGQVVNAPNTSPLLVQPARSLFKYPSVSLAEVVRDVNKYSNNVLAQHVFLALPTAAPPGAVAAPVPGQTIMLGDARRAATRWWELKLPNVTPPTLDNGSGLSRSERISALGVAKLIQHMAASPEGPGFLDSLPVAGVDGTLNNLRGSSAQGKAQLKTGSLRDATALAGTLTTAAGEQLTFVTLYNGTQTTAARQAMYCLLQRSIYGNAAPTAADGRNLCSRK